MRFGIDLSHHQNPAQLAWSRFEGAVDFVICRAAYGAGLRDRHFEEHARRARAIGAKVGLYLFYRPIHSPAAHWDLFRSLADQIKLCEGDLVPALDHLATALERKAEEFADVVKSGRTHLMDATPVTLGQEFGGYAAICRLGVERLDAVLPRVCALPLGGTAVGTGINAPDGFAAAAVAHLAETTGLPFTEAADHFEAQGGRDSLVELSGVLRTIAVGLVKVCNDLRWMGSGPTTGLAEIAIPDLQPGSSIMPGKVNPVVCEAVLQVCSQVVGNDAAVTMAGASGSFELNVQLPLIGRNVSESLRLLASSSRLLADRCVAGITAHSERLRAYAESSPSIVTPLNKHIGYEAAAAIAKDALKHGRTIREQVIEAGYVERFDEIICRT